MVLRRTIVNQQNRTRMKEVSTFMLWVIGIYGVTALCLVLLIGGAALLKIVTGLGLYETTDKPKNTDYIL